MFTKSTAFRVFAALLLAVSSADLQATPEPSLVPIFGLEGTEFTTKAQNDNVVHGWLPKDWDDNSEWAPISATYTKLADSPDKELAAVQIKIEKMAEGQLQLTSYDGNRVYGTKGKSLSRVRAVRSAGHLAISVLVRQSEDPYELHAEQEFDTDLAWKPFEFKFTPDKDYKAIIMLAVKNIGTIDIAGIVVTEDEKVKASSSRWRRPIPPLTLAASSGACPHCGQRNRLLLRTSWPPMSMQQVPSGFDVARRTHRRARRQRMGRPRLEIRSPGAR